MTTRGTDISSALERLDRGACERISRVVTVDALIDLGIAAFEIFHRNPALVTPETSRLLQVARDRSRWAQGHEVFDALRDRTLELERGLVRKGDIMVLYFMTAENLSRIIYNSTLPNDPFDEDSAMWFILTLARAAREIGPTEVLRGLFTRALSAYSLI